MADIMEDPTLTAEDGVLPPWLFRMCSNLGVYLAMLTVGYATSKYVKSRPEPSPTSSSLVDQMTRFIFYGPPEAVSTQEDAQQHKKPEATFTQNALKLAFCVAGLLTSFLMWGLMQERVMITEYASGRFQSSNFMVFCSRSFGFCIALAVTSVTAQDPLRVPFYMYSFTSFSNVMSSWCQLESLKYLSFPTQVLGKSSKMIPVMIMGIVLSGKKYPLYEYGVAVVILIGVAVFVLAEKADKASNDETVTSVAGLALMVLYLTFDSFTSQWQGRLFREYKMSSYQMMLGVNAFSASFTGLSLLQTGEMITSLNFVTQNLDCARDVGLFAVCGATGSMFIFFTIKEFGPLVFTMIMVTRQLVAIVLSCIFYGHKIQPSGMGGAAIVFSAIGYKIWRKKRDTALAKLISAKGKGVEAEAELEQLTKGSSK